MPGVAIGIAQPYLSMDLKYIFITPMKIITAGSHGVLCLITPG